jgi:hypothetical protein
MQQGLRSGVDCFVLEDIDQLHDGTQGPAQPDGFAVVAELADIPVRTRVR